MSPSKKGLFVSLILALGFMAGGIWLKRKFYSQTDHTNKKTLEILERDGALPISLPHALTGETVNLSAYKGKFTIVHFWATWCGPCIKEFPYLRKAYEKFSEKGFEVLSISFDNRKETALAYNNKPKNNFPWLSAIEEKGFSSQLAKTFEISAIPFTILIDPYGKILALDDELRGENLMRTLETHIK